MEWLSSASIGSHCSPFPPRHAKIFYFEFLPFGLY